MTTRSRSAQPKYTIMDWDKIQFPPQPMTPSTFTPMYLTQDFQPDSTTYNMMNDWMRLQGRVANKAGPVMYNGGDGFQEMPSVVMADNDNEAAREEQDEKFEHTYSQLAHQIAYRYPNPGLPRIRQGAIGGTWRHIKEVLGHHGSRVCFVDGLVSVYDTDRFSEALQPPLPYKGKLVHPPFAPTRDEFANSKKSVTFPPVERQRTASAPRHKGHYQFK